MNKEDIINLLKMATKILKDEPNLIYVTDPVQIVGDLHGQFYDFCNLLKNLTSNPNEKNKIIFLGDYVDRGMFGLEIIIIITALKINFP